ncbi:MAG: LysE family translocator [Myxococcales bacterium]|nr:MAG: LysE family translocator [Myxococcales bacterium]
MEALDLTYWIVFISAAVALNLSPGPDLIYVLSRTVAQGRKVGLASSVGVCTGALVHVAAAAFGLSAILASSAVAFAAIKYAGAVYLCYLGIKAWRHAGSGFHFSQAKDEGLSVLAAFKQGALTDILNPKVAIFFMAFLPQFVRPDAGNPQVQIVVLGLLVIGLALASDSILILLAAKATDFFRNDSRFTRILDRTLGTILIGLGLRLAFAEK